ncbi:uncharacterized protein LOC143588081 [Bidens hawaiensis]|uniref:uncharacterized protein LOC143588081 n=1 Tax=Bidens hawaiensis TaxID=980011 RepID=UPI00404B1E5F
MDKQTRGSSSFTENLFGPKDVSSTSSSSLFSSVFGPSSTVSSSFDITQSFNEDTHHTPRSTNLEVHMEIANLQHQLKKDGCDINSGSASRGNWWQGSLYY